MSFNICVVGCGNVAQRYHGPSYRRYAAHHPEVELAACCDLDEGKAVLFKEQFGFSRCYTCMDQMIDIEKPHAICLIAPVHLTATLSSGILAKGIPLMMEKPPGLNSKETSELIRSACLHQTPTQVAFNRRYTPLVLKLKELLQSHCEQGEHVHILYRMLRTGRKDPDFSTTAIHGIDAVAYLAGSRYRNVAFRYHERSEMGSGVADIHMECRFESGVMADLDFFPVAGRVAERLEVTALNHSYVLELPLEGTLDYPGRLLQIKNNRIVLNLSGPDLSEAEPYILNGFYKENEIFFDDIRQGRKPAGDIESGLQSVEIAECIRNRRSQFDAETRRILE